MVEDEIPVDLPGDSIRRGHLIVHEESRRHWNPLSMRRFSRISEPDQPFSLSSNRNCFYVASSIGSGIVGVTHARQNAAHERNAFNHSRHRIVAVNLVLKIDKPFVASCDQCFEDLAYRHLALTNIYLAFLALEVCEVFDVHVKEPRAYIANGLDDIGAGAHCVPDIDAAADARIELFDRLEHIQRGGPDLILRPVVVDSDADIVLLHKLLNARKDLRRWIACDNH